MISIVVAEPIDVLDAGEVADFGGGQTAHGCRCSAARAHRLTSVASDLVIREANVPQCRAEEFHEVTVIHVSSCIDAAVCGDRRKDKASLESALSNEARVVDATEFRVRRNGDVEHVATVLVVLSPVEVESNVKRKNVAKAVIPAAPAEIVVTEK